MKFITALLCALAPLTLFATDEVDRNIEATARAAYNFRVLLHDSITVQVEEGVVTLTGTVPDGDLKPLAEDTVSGLPGVTRVENLIAVAPQPPMHSDEAIAMRIRTLLLVKSEVDTRQTKVEVNNGVVSLSGRIGSGALKRRVSDYVEEIDGITGVNNDLEVRATPLDQIKSEMVDDASITAQVKFTLATNRVTADLGTTVEARRGVVVLRGGRGTEEAKACAVRLVSAVRGVERVVDRIDPL